jgi:tetratricopeptide (TPR) repeat protein
VCAQRARDLAPGWPPAKQFLKGAFKGGAKPEWLKLPEAIRNSKAPALSVCLIARNEEKFLTQCLNSIRPIARQIIVVDTGSTDATVRIAKESGAEVHSFPWCDDFSAARNAALEHATGDWVLILDADEELPAGQHPNLLADMKKADVIADRLPLVNQGQEASGRNFVPRLFRNAPGIYFYGRIHEQIFPSILPFCKLWGLRTAMGTAEILHHGYTRETMQDRNKVERNLKLLRQANHENPGDVILTMNLGLELVRSGNLPDGVAKYREAFELMSKLPAREITPETREVLLTQFTSQLYKVHAHQEIVQVLDSPLAKNGGLTASLNFALGLAQFALGNHGEAAGQIRQCLAKRRQPALSPINTDILTSMPNHCLALALAKTNDPTRAEKAFLSALGENGRTDDVKLDYAKFLVGTNRPLDALHKLRELISANGGNVIVWRLGAEIALGRPEFLAFARDWTGEAMRYVAEDSIVVAQRAEALMLNGDTAAAIELWERLWNASRQPRTLAALILCQAIESPTTHAPEGEPEEALVSRAFIAWYQRLITMRCKTIVSRLNEQMDKLSRALPTAAQRIEKALAEAQPPKIGVVTN